LALAGLTAGDGGPKVGAATAPVKVSLDVDLEERWEGGYRVELRNGVLTIYGHLENGLWAYSMRADGEGKVRVSDYQGRSWLGTCWVEGRCLCICWDVCPAHPRPPRRAVGPGLLTVRLRPASPRKLSPPGAPAAPNTSHGGRSHDDGRCSSSGGTDVRGRRAAHGGGAGAGGG
jgi:hypothetical protein